MKSYQLTFLISILFSLTQNYAQTEQDPYFYFKSFDDTKIAFKDEGKGNPVLLLHGFISNGTSWDRSELKDSLLEEGYRVIVPDLRGNGRSDRPQVAEAYMHDAEIKDLMALADHLNLESYICIGYSRGSIVLAKLLTRETRITRAVLGGMGFDFTKPDWDRRIAFADAFAGRSALSEMTEGAFNYAKSIDADLKALGFLQDYQPVASPEELLKINLEILILCGDQDLDNGDPLELQKYLPNSDLVMVEGDHNNTYKQKNFAVAILEFLRD